MQNKVADAAMIANLSFDAAAGHACGIDFKVKPHPAAHPEFAWQKPIQGDMDAHPWTTFRAGEK